MILTIVWLLSVCATVTICSPVVLGGVGFKGSVDVDVAASPGWMCDCDYATTHCLGRVCLWE